MKVYFCYHTQRAEQHVRELEDKLSALQQNADDSHEDEGKDGSEGAEKVCFETIR